MYKDDSTLGIYFKSAKIHNKNRFGTHTHPKKKKLTTKFTEWRENGSQYRLENFLLLPIPTMEAQVNKERKMVEKGIFIFMNYFL
jgi:hypothetical protein